MFPRLYGFGVGGGLRTGGVFFIGDAMGGGMVGRGGNGMSVLMIGAPFNGNKVKRCR